ncbi:MAG: hypothetical protein MRZ29_08145 [Oscillospiraceae bacterium]|nr:hypothetical protein [Oscillospiraceae bacterium]
MKNKLDFTIKTTNQIKGIALLLMFASHLFSFPEWLVSGNEFISIPFRNNTVAYFVGKFGGVCVGIFMFLTGYGMYFSYQKGNCIVISIKKAIKFILKYWILLFTFFLPVQILLGRTYFNPHKWHQELFGIYTSIVGFAWYVRFYMLAILSLPLLKRIIGKKLWSSLTLTVIPFQTIYILLWKLSTHIMFHNAEAVTLEYFKYISIVLVGYCFAKFDIYKYIDKFICTHKINGIFISVSGLSLIFIARLKWYENAKIFMPNADIVFVPILVFCIIKLLNNFPFKLILQLLEIIGQHSMNLWFLQSIFFFETNKLQCIIYLPKLPLLILIWNIAILLPISKLYNLIYKKIHII